MKRDKENNDQRINPRRRYNNYKYICTQHRSTSICKTNTNTIKWEIDSNTITVGNLNTPLVKKHLTGGFLCAVLDLSGILRSLLIPEYSGIKRIGWGIQAFPSLVFQYGDKYPLPTCEPHGKSDSLQLSLSLIWITYVL